MEFWEKFEKLRAILGDETVLNSVLNYFSSDQINEFCNNTITIYDIENEFENN